MKEESMKEDKRPFWVFAVAVIGTGVLAALTLIYPEKFPTMTRPERARIDALERRIEQLERHACP